MTLEVDYSRYILNFILSILLSLIALLPIALYRFFVGEPLPRKKATIIVVIYTIVKITIISMLDGTVGGGIIIWAYTEYLILNYGHPDNKKKTIFPKNSRRKDNLTDHTEETITKKQLDRLSEESNPPQNINNKDNSCNVSLSKEGETPKTYGNYNVYGTDIALQKDTAPINNTQKDYKTLVTDDIAPIVKTIIQSEISTEPPKQTAPIFNEKVYFSQLFSDIYDAFLNFRNSIECVLIGYGLKNFLSSNEKFFSVITVSFFMQLVEFEVKTKFKEEYILEQKALTEAMLQEIAEAEQLSYDKLNNFYSETKKKSCFNLPDNEKPRLHKVANTFFDTLLSLQFEIQKPSSDAIKDITEQFYVMVENIKKTL